MASVEPGSSVKSVDRLFEIIHVLDELNGARVTEVATRLDMPKSTVHDHLSTMHQHEYVVKEGNEYYLSLQFLRLGEHARWRKEAYRLTYDKVSRLAERTGERAQFIIEEHGKGVYVHRETGEYGVKTNSDIGERVPLHATAAGKAILSALPVPYMEALLAELELEQFTEYTVTDVDELRTELEVAREQNYVFNEEEYTKGLTAVGVPVLEQSGAVLGAISLSGPTYRMQGDWFTEEVPSMLLGTVNELELDITFS
ncbi:MULTISPECIES: IclR family transcriptional regulator [Natronorubrum]|uniref:IclR family transcriptional regulator n=2 Tax=Natronorubrum bangense TaxID=61858 RepID=L9W1U1_9EURY|nr:IclR family transcriptional regulator [Natronorubrum bangense]ELY43307.1 IclR family transcriptional regulator [Natronorubrum bangense JCM 10635]QCC57090.1 IclR family transcriptional regulator [Natronorubrum bangense]